MDAEERAERAIEGAVEAFEAQALGVIAARIGKVEGSLSGDLSHTAADMKAIGRSLEEAGDDAAKAVEKAMGVLEDDNEKWAAPLYEAAGAAQTGAAAAIVAKAAEEAKKAVRAICETSVIGLVQDDRTGFVPLREAYRAVVSRASTAMARGEADGRKAVSEAVRRLAAHGLRVRYDSGRTMELHSAVRMNVMDAFRRAMQESRLKMGEEFGADGVEVSAHGTCALDHVRYQGRQFSNRDFERIQRRLERPIGQGYNCRHTVFPIILGVSEPAYTEAELREIERMSAKEVEATMGDGTKRTMTVYEATQQQRRLERAIKRSRLDAYLAEKGGLDPSDNNRRTRALMARYRAFSKEAGLETDLQRTRLYIPR